VTDGIRPARRVVSALRARANLLIATSNLAIAELKRLLTGHFALETIGLRVFVTSFPYRHGSPRDADVILDVRFLADPHYVPKLRARTGCDTEVAAHIERDPDLLPFFIALRQWLRPLLHRDILQSGCAGTVSTDARVLAS
jgi:RNase adapter protein RapZ